MDHLDFEVTDDIAEVFGSSSSIISWIRNKRRSSVASKGSSLGAEENVSRGSSRRSSVDLIANRNGPFLNFLANPSKKQHWVPHAKLNDSKSSRLNDSKSSRLNDSKC